MSQTLRERLEALKALREKETKGERDYRYLSDLNLSIKRLERKVENGEGHYVMVDQMITMFGKSQDEILKLIKDDESKKRMTREDALLKIQEAADYHMTMDFIRALEALGLLKFEEENNISIKYAISYVRGRYSSTEDFIKGLGELGYKIVPK